MKQNLEGCENLEESDAENGGTCTGWGEDNRFVKQSGRTESLNGMQESCKGDDRRELIEESGRGIKESCKGKEESARERGREPAGFAAVALTNKTDTRNGSKRTEYL